MGFAKDVAGWVSGYTPAKKLYNSYTEQYQPDAGITENPYSASERKTDLGRSGHFQTYATRDRGNLLSQGTQLNNQAQGYNPLIEQLQLASQGQGPSLASLQLQQALGQNIAQQMAAAQNGSNPVLSQRLAAQNIAGLGQNSAMQSAQARIQEQQNAIGNLLSARQAQSGTTGQAANLYGNLNSMDMNAAMNYQNMAETLAERDRQARMGLNSSNQAAFDSAKSRSNEFWSKIGGAAGSLAGGGGAAGLSRAPASQQQYGSFGNTTGMYA